MGSKRRVAFHHNRKASAGSQLTEQRDGAKSRNERRQEGGHRSPSGSPFTMTTRSPGSPELENTPPIRSRKGTTAHLRLPPAVRKDRAQSTLFKEEARKVSSELEKYCEEAFGSTLFSDAHTSVAKPRQEIAPLDASISTSGRPDLPIVPELETAIRPRTRGKVTASQAERPLPPPPVGAFDSFTEAQLRETRNRLVQRSVQGEAGASQAYLDDVIVHLDRLMQPSTVRQIREGDGRRIASAGSGHRSPNGTAHLPAISEEARSSGREGSRQEGQSRGQSDRTVSAPLSPRPRLPDQHNPYVPLTSTIRLVPPSTLPPMALVAPLNVRKRSEQTASTGNEQTIPSSGRMMETYNSKVQDGGLSRQQVGQVPSMHEDEHGLLYQHDGDDNINSRHGKGVNWFRRNVVSGAKETGRRRGSNEKASIFTDVGKSSANETAGWFKDPIHNDDLENEHQKRKMSNGSGGGGKKVFFKIFGNRGTTKGDGEEARLSLGGEF